MAATLRETMARAGARFAGETGPAEDFGDPAAELDAARNRVALADGSAFGRLRGTGPDLPDLLQRLGTGDLRGLASGEGRATVLTTPKGRIVARVFVHRTARSGLLLRVGPGASERVLGHLARFTFREQTGLEDLGERTRQLLVVGPGADAAIEAAGFARPGPLGLFETGGEEEGPMVIGGDGASAAGFAFVVVRERAPELWERLLAAVRAGGGTAAGALALEACRILAGVPLDGNELTDEYNPLEADLWDDVSFSKGCYVGQEVVARLNTYDKVSRKLVGLEMAPGQPAPRPGARVLAGDVEAGQVTSAIVPPGRDRAIALALVKRKAARPELAVRADDGTIVDARMVELPFGA